MNKVISFVSITSIIFFFLLNIYLIVQNSLIFNIDVARDLLLIKEIVEVNHTMLIGARTSLPGLFHGPAWLYLNIPAYFIGNGNPQVFMWYWLLLYGIFVSTVFFITKKLFDSTTALLTAALLSSQAAFYINKATNPYGAALLFPVFYYFLIQYLQSRKIKNLLISFIIIGFIIQFEIVFGLAILLVTIGYLAYVLKKNRTLPHLLSVFIILIPLSTYILFDLKNNFLQLKSVLNLAAQTGTNTNIVPLLTDRIVKALVYGWQQFHLSDPYGGYFLLNTRLLNIFVGMMILYGSYKALRRNKFKYKTEVIFFFLVYMGFWILTLALKEKVEWYYFWPFVSVVTMIFVLLREYVQKKLFFIVFWLIILNNTFFGIKLLQEKREETYHWKFQEELANSIYKNNGHEFGYFINTLDQVSMYPPYYAMEYFQKKFPTVNSAPFEKKKYTYIIIAPYPDGKPLDNKWWKENKAKIMSSPQSVTKFKNGFVVERYELIDEELKISADTAIFNSTEFR